ncbi:hypothetical protein BJV82DRAFT_587961 [Fennellomyces sp. T-0311]|nr:hypothetical protein BJV82DRAFT_587961 [Fennellomyces sp. T-0311]
MIGYCTLDDYLQLQLLLQHEQQRRERAIQHHLQHHGALRHRNAQQYRLARAMHNLKALKENYRRARAYQIQKYMEYYRNQALAAAVEDAFFRPSLALAIERRRADTIRQQREQARGAEEDVHAKQLSNLLRLLFDHQFDQEVKQQEYQEERSEANDDDQEAEDLWHYITNLQQQDRESEEEEEEPEYEEIDRPFEQSPVKEHIPAPIEPDIQEAMQESPIRHLAQEPVLSDQPVSFDNRSHGNHNDEVHDAVNKVLHRRTAQAKEPEAVNVIDNRAGVPESPYMEDINPHEYDNDAQDDPPLDSSVLNLKDLLNELVSDSSDCPSPAPDEKPEDDTLFAPKHVVTAAEPTPQQEHAPVQNQDDDEEDFVHKIAEQQKQNFPPADPAKYEQLQEIDRQLEDIRANRQAKVLSTPLHFQNKAGSLQLTATTPQNREFLGCEDEIMRNMLKLDTIDSNGDEGIRSERKALVKKAESLLEQLDEHKQQEWERVRKPKAAHHHKKKKNRRPRHHQQHHNKAGGILVG